MAQRPGRLAALLLALAAVVFLSQALAQQPVPALAARVTDLTGTLSAEQRTTLEQSLAQFEARKGAQIAILMLSTTAPETVEQFAVRVQETWKLGRKGIDDGVLVVVAKQDRRLKIEVGYGLEGVLPDALAKRIIEQDITPQFKQGDFFSGLRAGTDRIMRLIDGEKLPAPATSGPGATRKDFLSENLIFGLVIVLMVSGMMRAMFGRFFGAGGAGLAAGAIGWFAAGGTVALVLGAIAFLFTLFGNAGGGRSSRYGGGGYGSGGGGGFSSGGGFSGGGGGSGGGGASGSW